ncbi:MAG: hypothetical protein KIT31_42825 [Deltaproteobacteria bacterium]|nr:hypothetical protein [Deltaproteobacteria bacterium]
MRTMPTTELESRQLKVLLRESTNLEVELIREDPPSGSVQIMFGDDECASRAVRARGEIAPISDGDPLPAGARTRLDRDALAPLPRPHDDEPMYPTYAGPRVRPALVLGLALAGAVYVALWIFA